MAMARFIVAEITKNWEPNTPVSDLLSQKFEGVININVDRGYKLVDWRLTSAYTGECFTETIIAIFERIDKELTPEELTKELIEKAKKQIHEG